MLQSGCPPNKVILAVVRAIEQSKLDRGGWKELGLLTGTDRLIEGHPRLLSSLRYNDDDYHEQVIDLVPKVLGRKRDEWGETSFRNFSMVEEFLDLPNWLYANDRELYEELYGNESMSDALDWLDEATGPSELLAISEYASRIRRCFPDDLPAAIGAAKELLEAVFKQILAAEGISVPKNERLPTTAARVHRVLGIDDGRPPSADELGSHQRKDILKALNLVIQAKVELRNLGFGTGHGQHDRPKLDIATARLAVTSAIGAATFYLEVADIDR